MSKPRKPTKPLTIVQAHAQNFETLKQAFLDGNVCLLDCIDKASGEHVAVICATKRDAATGMIDMIPFARFFNGNPYEMLESPLEYDADVQPATK